MTKDIRHLRRTLKAGYRNYSASPCENPKAMMLQYDAFVNITDKTYEIKQSYIDGLSEQQYQIKGAKTHPWKEGTTYEEIIEWLSNKGFRLLPQEDN